MAEKRKESTYSGAVKLIWLSIAILTVGLLPLFLNLHQFAVTDFTDQEIPFILETKRMFSSGAPWWSWNTFSGDNFIGAYGFYTVTSPFVWLICLFPVDKIIWGIFFGLYLKTICTSLFAFLYFRKMQFSSSLSIVGGLMYGFSSFYISNLFYFHFCEPIMMFPLLLIAIEKVARKESNCYLWLALCSFVVVFINFYFAFSSFLLGLIYYLFRTHSLKSFSFLSLLKTIGCVTLGILLDSFILLPVLYHSSGSARATVATDPQFLFGFDPSHLLVAISYYVGLLRLLVSPQISDAVSEDSFIGHTNYNSCEPYVTLFGLFLIAIYIWRKRDWLAWLLVLLLVIYITPINGIFTLFTCGAYRRWLYGFVLLGTLASLYVVKEKSPVSRQSLWIYIDICLIIYIINFLLSFIACDLDLNYFIVKKDRYFQFALMLFNLICLFIWVFNPHRRKLLLLLICGCSTFNLAGFSFSAINSGARLGKDTLPMHYNALYDEPYGDNSTDFRFRYDDETNYRNIALLQNRPGICSFHSISNKALLPFRKELNDALTEPILYNVLANRHSTATLLSVKEVKKYKGKLLAENPNEGPLKLIRHEANYDLYENETYIPMGFAYDSYITLPEMDKAKEQNDSTDVMLMLLDNILINKEDVSELSRYLRKGKVNTDVQIDSIASLRRNNTISNFKGDSKGFTCTSDFAQDRFIFFSVAHDPGFSAYIDDTPVKIYNVNLGMSGIVVPKGPHTIKFSYFPPGLKWGSFLSLLALVIFISLVLVRKRHEKRLTDSSF